MNFTFSKDEELWQWAVRDFADRELAPKALTLFDQSFRDILRKMGELGFFGVKLPEKYGGDPASWVMMGILAEEIAKVHGGIAYYLLVSSEVALSLAAYGTEPLQDALMPGLIEGRTMGCIALTEPQAGADAGALAANAIHKGDHYQVSGEKKPVSFGMEADLALLFVKTEPGITALCVPLTLPGITRLPVHNMGLFLTVPASLRCEGVEVPLTYRIGQEGEGLRVNGATGLRSDVNQIISALICLGVAQTALRLTISYSKERHAFGRPIGKFEAISNKLAEDATLIEAGRWLCYRALSLKELGSPHMKEAAMCGWWCPKIAYQVVQDSLLTHGHAGYCDDHPFQQMLRDLVAFEMIAGTEQMLKLIISRDITGPVGVPDAVSARMGDY
jgi:cyclohexanecarboxyl-CoA dehydrogenase